MLQNVQLQLSLEIVLPRQVEPRVSPYSRRTISECLCCTSQQIDRAGAANLTPEVVGQALPGILRFASGFKEDVSRMVRVPLPKSH